MLRFVLCLISSVVFLSCRFKIKLSLVVYILNWCFICVVIYVYFIVIKFMYNCYICSFEI